jgi:rhodanese-related sulfurtransferase
MHEIISFLGYHIELTSVFLLLCIAYVFVEMRDGALSPTRLPAQKVVDLMNHQGAIVIDCRDVAEYKLGHIANAVNIPYDQLIAQEKPYNQYKNKTVILVLASNAQFNKVKARLSKDECNVIGMLAGGMAAWREAQLPVLT